MARDVDRFGNNAHRATPDTLLFHGQVRHAHLRRMPIEGIYAERRRDAIDLC